MIRKLLTKLVLAKKLPSNPYPGEMLPVERLRLYQWMTEYSPKVVLEVGTGVGGSTFYISEALNAVVACCIRAIHCDVRRRTS